MELVVVVMLMNLSHQWSVLASSTPADRPVKENYFPTSAVGASWIPLWSVRSTLTLTQPLITDLESRRKNVIKVTE